MSWLGKSRGWTGCASDGIWAQNDFRNELFEGFQHLLLLADKIEEIKTICNTVPARRPWSYVPKPGKPVYDEVDQIGGHRDIYLICRKHYF